MDGEFNIVIEKGEDGYLISEVIGLPGCHSQAKTLDELVARTREAISLYLKCEKGLVVKDRFLGVQKITLGS